MRTWREREIDRYKRRAGGDRYAVGRGGGERETERERDRGGGERETERERRGRESMLLRWRRNGAREEDKHKKLD